MKTVDYAVKPDAANNWRHNSPNIGRNVDGIRVEWMEVWNEVECWKGDVYKSETGYVFLLRLQSHYYLTGGKSFKDIEGVSAAWVELWDDIDKWYCDPKKGETGRDFLLRMQKKYQLAEKLLKLEDAVYCPNIQRWADYWLGRRYVL